MEQLLSKFFNAEDERIEQMDDFSIPAEWWSRFHEYAWAVKFLNENDVIIDAGCGTTHPFKEYAAKRVKECWAVDQDPVIGSYPEPGNLRFLHGNICEIASFFNENSVDKIFCISVLEHMYAINVLDTLKQFKQILKPDGQILLTIDYPTLPPDTLMSLVNEAGLMFAGSVDYEMDKNKVLKGPYGNLKCYRAILCKPEEIKEPIPDQEPEKQEPGPSEKKPRKPKEIK